MNYDAIRAAAAVIADKTGRPRHRVAVVLGSGFSGCADSLPGAVEIPYADIPGFPIPGVEGHSGTLSAAQPGKVPALCFSGRVHAYEGWEMADVVFGVRTAVAAGCRTIILTNAAGAAGYGLDPGDLVLLKDHLNLAGRNPLVGVNDERMGPRFPDLTDTYPEDLRAAAGRIAAEAGGELKEGVYAWFLGPTFETPAEVEMARRLGADLVGMSTVPEAIAARHMGAKVLGISLVTNLAAGMSPVPISHEQVQETAAAARKRFTALIDGLLRTLE